MHNIWWHPKEGNDGDYSFANSKAHEGAGPKWSAPNQLIHISPSRRMHLTPTLNLSPYLVIKMLFGSHVL